MQQKLNTLAGKPLILIVLICAIWVKPLLSFAKADLNNDSLYEAVVEAQDQGANAREQLFQNGLVQVLQRVSGDESIPQNEKLKEAIKNAEQLVEQFGYSSQSLSMRFNRDAVNELVFSLNQPIWGQKRPTVLLWLAVAKDNLSRNIIGAEQNPELHQTLQDFAFRQGLPLILPMMDLTDMNQVTVSDIWGDFPTVLAKASERYGADAIIVAKVQKSYNNLWGNQWQLVVDEHVKTWDWQAEDYEAGLKEGIDKVTAHLLMRYGLNDNGQSQSSLLIGIKAIRNLNDFAKAEAYLNSLEQLSEVQIQSVNNDEVVFEVKPNNGVSKEIVSQVIGMDDSLKTLKGRNENTIETTDLVYQLKY